ncbi:XRE family transcriptional regulator [Amycolatopsis tucumanensis]|uniref:HTH cro/C1-type domain-containing protein n=1 Tax=Amycolatopsis tucumanensis TaxID=401106 RepID=A0ABP7HME7_9PSEU|nr:XRE family transcriptional regulator [Amycolatopsis tucumanensis]MCF6420863.1 XRE family transcriptional regulator [Amycolatopsis tucumanensis]
MLSAARGQRRLSQRELARLAGVPQSTVATIEAGRRQPSVAMLERLLRAAGFHLATELVNALRPSELLERQRRSATEVLARYPVTRAWLTGPAARGEDRPDSGLDLAVALRPAATADDIAGLAAELSGVLGCPVEVTTGDSGGGEDFFYTRSA